MTPEGYAVELNGGMFILYFYQDMNIPSMRFCVATSYDISEIYRAMMSHKTSYGRDPTLWIG